MLRLFLTCTALLIPALALLIIGFLLNASWPLLQTATTGLLTATEWYPPEQLFGMLPAIAGSAWVVVLALLIAVPGGVAAAIVSAQLLPDWGRRGARLLMDMLAGIPSVVYGLIGLWLLLPTLQSQAGLITGHSLLAAGLLLAVMILPTIMVLSEDALTRVPQAQIQTARILGLDWSGRLVQVLLPQAWPGIRLAILLASGRALGETIAVMLVVGSIERLPEPWYNLLQPAQTLTARIGREMAEASVGSLHWSALMFSGLLLALASMSIALLTRIRRPVL